MFKITFSYASDFILFSAICERGYMQNWDGYKL